MTLTNFIIILFIPFNVEYALNLASNSGNIGLHGVFLEIYRKRNILYLSFPVLFISYRYNYLFYGMIFTLFSLYFYIKSCCKWFSIIHNEQYTM